MSKLAEEILQPRSYLSKLQEGHPLSKKDILSEWLNAINLFKNPEAIGAHIWLLQYVLCAFISVSLLLNHLSVPLIFWLTGFILINAHFYHTFWYHRYCSHKAFAFRSKLFPLLIQWTNPLLIKEEIYIIPHFVHHKISDSPRDPYGPHLGSFGSFMTPESQHYFNRSMSERAFSHCKGLIGHIPTIWQSKAQFQTNGSFEIPILYVLRFLFVNAFWIVLFLMVFKSPALLGAWYLAIFIVITILRDFNYRGHDQAVDKESKVDKKSFAVNHWFYGYLASEWHDNHHRFSASAKCGFKPFELDISFILTKLLKRLSIIRSYVDSSKSFKKEQEPQSSD